MSKFIDEYLKEAIIYRLFPYKPITAHSIIYISFLFLLSVTSSFFSPSSIVQVCVSSLLPTLSPMCLCRLLNIATLVPAPPMPVDDINGPLVTND